jgi:cell wall-associated NlpC family hydrolase
MSLSQKPQSSVAEQRAAVVAEAMTWLRTPYHHLARVKGAGVDCAQILIAVYAAASVIDAFDPGFYVHDWMLHRSEEIYLGWVEKYAHCVEVPQPGDIALYRFGRTVSHAAIVVDWPTVIHAHLPDRMVVLADAEKGELPGRLFGFYSLWGAE